MATRSSAIFTLASVTILTGLVAYAVYFDYRRRNDAEFRKKLRECSHCCSNIMAQRATYTGKEKKRVDKQTAQGSQSASGVSMEELRAALAVVKEEPMPSSSEEKEQYFMTQVGLGEQLCAQGAYF